MVMINNYRDILARSVFNHSAKKGLSLLLYDVTKLSTFEVQQEDDYRKSGISKERRLEPQISRDRTLVDQSGFPLGLHSLKGNTAEIKPFCR